LEGSMCGGTLKLCPSIDVVASMMASGRILAGFMSASSVRGLMQSCYSDLLALEKYLQVLSESPALSAQN
jgi:hypothetical protein